MFRYGDKIATYYTIMLHITVLYKPMTMKKLLHLHNNATYYSVMKIKKKKNDNNEQYSYTVTKLS